MAERTNPQILKNGVAVGRSYKLNFIEGSNVTLTVSSDGDQSTNVTIASTGGGPGGSMAVKEDDVAVVASASTFDFGTGFDVAEAPAGEANISLDLTEVTVLTGVSFAGNVA